MLYKNFEIKEGNTGEYVQKLQYILGLTPDGIFGNITMSTLLLSYGISYIPSKIFYDLLDDVKPEYIKEAKKYVGKIKELDIDGDGTPDNRDPLLDQITKYVFDWYNPSEKDEGYPWCAIFISYVLNKAYGTKFKDARVIKWKEHLQDVGKRVYSKIDFEKNYIYIGLWLNQSGFGHIFFIDPIQSFEFFDDVISTIEGNTNDGGSRDGDGVYRRTRTLSKRGIEVYKLKE